MIFNIDLNRFKHLFREDLRVLLVEYKIQAEDIFQLSQKIDIISIDILSGDTNISLDIEYVNSRIGVRAKLKKLDINIGNIESVIIDVVKTQSREYAADVEKFLLSLNIVFVTDFLSEFKEADPDTYYEWATLLKTKELFRKVVDNMKPLED